MPKRWVRQLGDGLVYQGACLVYNINLFLNDAGDWVDIYDGLDTESGKFFQRLESAVVLNVPFRCSVGVPFATGIYLDTPDADVSVVVVFEPL